MLPLDTRQDPSQYDALTPLPCLQDGHTEIKVNLLILQNINFCSCELKEVNVFFILCLVSLCR